MKRNGMAALLLAAILGATACGDVEQGNQEETQQTTVQKTEESKQAESEEEAGTVGGLEYPIFAETDNAPFIEDVIESEGIYCVYGQQRGQDCYFGFLTETGEEITPFIYEEAAPFSNGLACVYLDEKYGYIDKNGETALPFVYDYAAPFSEGLAYFVTGETYGFMDKNGETMFTLNCDSVSSFREGLAYFSIDGKYGYIDQTGVTVIQPVYDDADYFYSGRARVRVGGFFGVIDTQGWEVLPAVYDSISFEEDYILAQADGGYYCYATDGDGGVTLLLNEEYIYKEWRMDEGDLFHFRRDGKAGLASSDGTILIQPMFDYLEPVADRELAIAQLRDDEGYCYGLVDFQGSIVVPFGEYDDYYYYSYGQVESGLLPVVKKQGEDGTNKAGYLDLADMTLRIPAVYDSAGSFYGGLAPVSRDGLYGLIDTDGNLVYPIEYKRALVVNEEGTVFLLREGETGNTGYLYDARGNLLYQARGLSYIHLQGECYELQWNNDKTSYLILNGEPVETEKFDSVSTSHSSQSNICLGYRWTTDRNNVIIKTKETDTAVTDIEGAVLRNAVTPRNVAYFQVFLQRMKDTAFPELTRKRFRFYIVDGCEEPLLYYYEEPYQFLNFPASESGFYQMQDGQAVEIISGYECGGSLRGDHASLWYDRETGRVLPGAYESWGGFGGYNYGRRIYEKVGNGFEKAASFYCTVWFSPIDVKDEMQVTPELFYNQNDEPYTADKLPEEDEAVTEYEVNGNRVTMKRYLEEWDRYEELYSMWY